RILPVHAHRRVAPVGARQGRHRRGAGAAAPGRPGGLRRLPLRAHTRGGGGGAAAVWTAVADGGLRPICITGNKFYGTWGDPGPVQDELVEWLRSYGPN